MERLGMRGDDVTQHARRMLDRLVERSFFNGEGGNREGEAAEKGAKREKIACMRRAPREPESGDAIDDGNGRALPEEMDQGPAECFPMVRHRRCLFCSMRVRSASSSWSFTGSRASACIASCAADPANRRSLMSRTSWSWVSFCVAAGW